MARPTGFGAPGTIITLRSGSAVIAADSATLIDDNIPPAQAVNCWGLESIFIGAEITGGTNPTMTVEPLFRDSEAADGSRWRRLNLGALPGVTLTAAGPGSTGAMASDLSMVELRVFGATSVFFRISAVANATSTTAWKLLAMPGRYIGSPHLLRP